MNLRAPILCLLLQTTLAAVAQDAKANKKAKPDAKAAQGTNSGATPAPAAKADAKPAPERKTDTKPGPDAKADAKPSKDAKPAPEAKAAAPIAVAAVPDDDDTSSPLFSLDVHRQDIEVTLQEFAKKCGRPLSIPELPTQLISVTFKDLPFTKALRHILAPAGLDFRMVEDGYVVGLPIDLKLRFPDPNETNLDATYRCRRVSASSLADALSKVVPDCKVTTGPVFLSPALDTNGSSGGGESIKTIGATDVSFKTHDVVISGPADQVRRALVLCEKFDRPRKQVRISIRIVQINSDDTANLGISWMQALSYSATEVPTAGTAVEGIRLGKFNHSPLAVTATLNALESRGHSKTLSNPTIMLLDGERSFILSGDRYLYPKYMGKDQTGQSLYDVAEAKIGIYLQVGVQIGLDNDMILSLYPQVTSLGTSRIINGAEYPSITTSEEQTTVRASSGEMVVLGGMLQEENAKNTSGIPFLSRLPGLGTLFADRTTTKTRTELMMMVTPELVEEKLPAADVKLTVRNPES